MELHVAGNYNHSPVYREATCSFHLLRGDHNDNSRPKEIEEIDLFCKVVNDLTFMKDCKL